MKKNLLLLLAFFIFSCELFFNPFLKGQNSESSPCIRIVSPVGSTIVEPSAGLVAYYPFNGNANDESGNSNHGTVSGATLISNRFGDVNSAYSFDGINDAINIGNGVKPTFPATICTWVYLNDTSGYPVFRNDFVDSGSNRYGLALYISGGRIYSYVFEGFSAPDNRRGKTTTAAPVTAGAWHHVAIVFNSLNNHQLYCDGVEHSGTYAGSGSSLGYSSNNGTVAHWWGSGSVPKYLDGSIDDIRVYDRALSACEIQQLFYYRRNLTFTVADLIDFSCVVKDLEDGELVEDSLVWTSDIDGQIGIGKSFSKALSLGDHVIIVSATDSQGNVGRSSIDVKVICAP